MEIFVEERRKENNEFMTRVNKFIDDSSAYRAKDEVVQKYQAEKLESVDVKVGIQNGRVYKLEAWKIEIEQKIKQRKDNYATIQAWITGIATVVMAVSAAIMIFKK